MGARHDRGAAGLEYGLLAAGLAMAVVVGATTLGGPLSDAFACIEAKLTRPESTPAQCASVGPGGGGVTPPVPVGPGTTPTTPPVPPPDPGTGTGTPSATTTTPTSPTTSPPTSPPTSTTSSGTGTASPAPT